MARPGLSKNVKFKRLVRTLGIPKPYVQGLLETMWDGAHECGNPVLGEPDDVEAACEWPGENGVLFKALRDCRFITEDGGKWVIHDYWHHAPDYVALRNEKEMERRKSKVCEKCGGSYRSTETHSRFCSRKCRQSSWRDEKTTDERRTATEPSVTNDAGCVTNDAERLTPPSFVTRGDEPPAPAPAPAPTQINTCAKADEGKPKSAQPPNPPPPIADASPPSDFDHVKARPIADAVFDHFQAVTGGSHGGRNRAVNAVVEILERRLAGPEELKRCADRYAEFQRKQGGNAWLGAPRFYGEGEWERFKDSAASAPKPKPPPYKGPRIYGPSAAHLNDAPVSDEERLASAKKMQDRLAQIDAKARIAT